VIIILGHYDILVHIGFNKLYQRSDIIDVQGFEQLDRGFKGLEDKWWAVMV
jgi:hypothetical protein